MSELSSRFRRATVSAPQTPAERLRRRLTGDGKTMYDAAAAELRDLVQDPDQRGDELLDLLEVAREHPDAQRVYALHKLAGAWLTETSHVQGRQEGDDELAWTAWFDLLAAALVPYLEQHPTEPELVNLLGVAFYELGDWTVARRLFEAVKQIEPEHMQVRRNLKACRHRLASGPAPQLPAAYRRRSAALHTAAKRIAERVVRLPERTVSLCMIVKDEEEMLPGCLEAAARWVDEVIVVDTGSTDRTREIAAEHGATVIDFAWTGSFSDARNRSIEDATGDWILYLDADEHLVDEDGRQLKKLAKKTWVEGFYLVETHFTGELEMGQQTTHQAMRLFQRRPEYRWEGIIHEQKLHAFPTYLPERFQNTSVRLNHYGYLRAVIDDRGKRQRNLELLEQQAAEGTSSFTEFNIGSEYSAMYDWVSARPHFEKALALDREDPGFTASQFAPMLVSRLVTARRAAGATDLAKELIAEALGWWPDFTDLLYERATIEIDDGEFATGEKTLLRCIAMGDAPAKYVAIGGRGSYQARVILAQLVRKRGEMDQARAYLEQAIEEAPFFLPSVIELADLELTRGTEPDEVEQQIRRLLVQDGPTVNLMLAATFAERGHTSHAERGYDQVLRASPGNPPAIIGLAELRLAEHRFEDALGLAGSIPEDHLWAARAARTEFLAGVMSGASGGADRALRILTTAPDVSESERRFYRAWDAVRSGQAPEDAPDLDAAVAVLQNLEALAKLEATEEFEQLVPVLTLTIPDERLRRMQLGQLYLRRRFADMAAADFLYCAQHYGTDPEVLTGLGKVATMKELWADARNFLRASLDLEPEQQDAQRLLELIGDRTA